MSHTLSEAARIALTSALVKRGPNKGLLLANPPPSRTLAYAAWMGAQINCNPHKVSIGGMLLFDTHQREVYREVDEFCETHKIRNLDRDRNALEGLGVWL